MFNARNPGVVFTQLREAVEAYRQSLNAPTDQWGNLVTPGYVSALRPDFVPDGLASFIKRYYASDPNTLIAQSAAEAVAMQYELAAAQQFDRTGVPPVENTPVPGDGTAPAPSPTPGGSNDSENTPPLGPGDQPPATTPTPAPVPPATDELKAAEQELLKLVNAERSTAGLEPFAWDEPLAGVARAHCADMLARNFFDHVNPDGKSPFDRMLAAGIAFKGAGENIHYSYETGAVAIARASLEWYRTSPPHWGNIMSSSFTRVGFGYARGADGKVVNTQAFMTP